MASFETICMPFTKGHVSRVFGRLDSMELSDNVKVLCYNTEALPRSFSLKVRMSHGKGLD